ncbi:hypothetical protein BD769DRAFT_1397098 [Suillus cothurnatus]|nr:hypothetical protein BD769DRAFT_1397098 [Suillus cothurnatus]
MFLDMVSGETSQMDLEEPLDDATGQPRTKMTQSDKREASRMDLDDVIGQSTSRIQLDKGRLPAKKKVVTTISDKRCIKEVDYSEALRQIVYNQTERMNNIRREMETDAQKKQSEYLCNMDETKRRWEAALREQEEKLAMARKELEDNCAQQQQQLQDHIRESGEALSQANRASIEASMQQILDDSRERLTQELVQREAKLGQELARCEEELSRKKNEEFREHKNVMFTEMERRLQHEVDKLKASTLFHSLICQMLKSTPQAEKECELANMEQRFAKRHRLQDLDIDMDTSHSRRKDAGQQSTPSANPFSGTSCLDTIKRIRRSRGVSHRTRLVSVVVDVDAVPQEQSSKQDIPPHNQHNTPPIASMEDAVARGVEAALRHVFINKEFPVTNKRSPQRRKKEQEEIQRENARNIHTIPILMPYHQKYLRRVTVLDHLVKQMSDKNREDLPAWQWLQLLVKTLGEGSMSSEESDIENQIEMVLCVKNMVWHHVIERELDIVDHQRLMDDDIFAPKGEVSKKATLKTNSVKLHIGMSTSTRGHMRPGIREVRIEYKWRDVSETDIRGQLQDILLAS